jgi:hypothetical protein
MALDPAVGTPELLEQAEELGRRGFIDVDNMPPAEELQTIRDRAIELNTRLTPGTPLIWNRPAEGADGLIFNYGVVPNPTVINYQSDGPTPDFLARRLRKIPYVPLASKDDPNAEVTMLSVRLDIEDSGLIFGVDDFAEKFSSEVETIFGKGAILDIESMENAYNVAHWIQFALKEKDLKSQPQVAAVLRRVIDEYILDESTMKQHYHPGRFFTETPYGQIALMMLPVLSSEDLDGLLSKMVNNELAEGPCEGLALGVCREIVDRKWSPRLPENVTCHSAFENSIRVIAEGHLEERKLTFQSEKQE